jgi:ras-responsive element-binding protein 1
MLRHRKKHSNALNNFNNFHNMKSENCENNGNGSSINNSASDLSDEESTSLAMNNNKKLMEMMSSSGGNANSKADQELVNRMVNNPINRELFLKFQEKFLSMQQQVNSELLGNLLGISDQGVLNRMFNSSADEAAKMLGVEK